MDRRRYAARHSPAGRPLAKTEVGTVRVVVVDGFGLVRYLTIGNFRVRGSVYAVIVRHEHAKLARAERS